MYKPEKKDVIFGVDIDGVLCDLVPSMKMVASEVLQCWPQNIPDPTTYNLAEAWNLSEQQNNGLWHLAIDKYRVFETAPAIQNCAEGLHYLRSNLGWYVKIITRRMNRENTTGIVDMQQKIVSDTVKFLSKHRIPYDDICFVENKGEVECDIAVDDSPHELDNYNEHNVPVIKFVHSYNTSWQPSFLLTEVKSWNELIAKVESGNVYGLNCQGARQAHKNENLLAG